MNMEVEQKSCLKVPEQPFVKKSSKFLEYAKAKANKKFVTTLFRTINRYRSRIFQTVEKYSKVNAFVVKFNKVFKINEIYYEAFTEIFEIYLSFKRATRITSPEFLKFFDTLKKARLRSLHLVIKRILGFTPRFSYYQNNIYTNLGIFESFYANEVVKRLMKLERRMRVKQEIQRSRAYLKILAYSKAIKFSSPFKVKNESPTKSPFRSLLKAQMYTPDNYRKQNRLREGNNPLYYPIFKMIAYFDQNLYMTRVVSFKHWKLQYLFANL